MSCAQAGSATNSLLSGIAEDVVAKIHRTIRCAPDCPVCTGLSDEPTASAPMVVSAIGVQSMGDAWP
jgi:hypothetical protein